jgi:hypothetical protein
VYEHILGIVRDTARSMEQSPQTYVQMGEEDRRQLFVNALNSHYSGQVTAEAFNASGKTDILVKYEDRNLFIGECKFWSGRQAFLAAVDQLFGYSTWRDSKLAAIIFVRQRGLTEASSTSTQSEPPCGPTRDRTSPPRIATHAGDTGRRVDSTRKRPFFSGLVETQHRRLPVVLSRATSLDILRSLW